MRLIAPAKINLYLNVIGKREDGYHELRTVMMPICLHDEIDLIYNEKGITLEGDDCGCSISNNLCYRAAELFFKRTSIKEGIRIVLKKNIPFGAGLGGGSSDASAILKGLNSFFNANLNTSELIDLASKLGADCPFFIRCVPSYMGSRGDTLISDVKLEDRAYLIVVPPFQLSTKEVYENYNISLTDEVEPIIINNELSFAPEEMLFNSLESVAFRMKPELEVIRKNLILNGAIGALMSGSGSAVFGVFKSRKKLTDAINNMNNQNNFRYISA